METKPTLSSKAKPICGAKTKSGKACGQKPMANGRCKLHGGLTPSGMDHHAFKHGKYSKHLPSRLVAQYEEAEGDPRLLTLRSDIALLESRLVDLIQRVDKGESGRLWRNLHTAYLEFRAAKSAGNEEEQSKALTTILTLIPQGASDYAAWDEITVVVSNKKKLIESERKRLIEMHQVITVERLMVLITALISAIREEVGDPATRNRLSSRLAKLIEQEKAAMA